MTASAAVWGTFLVVVVLLFTALEIWGVYFGAPWGAMTMFVRAALVTYPVLHFVVAGLVAFGYLHVFGGWP